MSEYRAGQRCLSSCSYIKPQLGELEKVLRGVVYHLVPTSNHNVLGGLGILNGVVYHLVPTSNHNCPPAKSLESRVVYHLVPTSNHNYH